MINVFLGIILLILSCGFSFSAEEYSIIDDLNLDFTYVDIRNRGAVEVGGLDEGMQFKRYRFMSERFLLSAGYNVQENITIGVIIGSAGIRSHSSEGETWEFSPALTFGLSASGVLYSIPEYSLAIRGQLRFLTLSASDSELVRLSNIELYRGDLSLDWTEKEIALDVAKSLFEAEIYLGIRYMSISADQKRNLSGVSYSSHFDQDDSVGFYSGLIIRPMDKVSFFGQVNFRDETSFQAGARYKF